MLFVQCDGRVEYNGRSLVIDQPTGAHDQPQFCFDHTYSTYMTGQGVIVIAWMVGNQNERPKSLDNRPKQPAKSNYRVDDAQMCE